MNATAPPFALPPVPHWPGTTPRPDDAIFKALKADLDRRSTAQDLSRSDAFQAGFAAFDAGYFWEAHEVWEAVWTRLAPASRERLLVQGLIQLANAGLKRRMGRTKAADRILLLADRALAEAFRSHCGALLGMTPVDPARLRVRICAI